MCSSTDLGRSRKIRKTFKPDFNDLGAPVGSQKEARRVLDRTREAPRAQNCEIPKNVGRPRVSLGGKKRFKLHLTRIMPAEGLLKTSRGAPRVLRSGKITVFAGSWPPRERLGTPRPPSGREAPTMECCGPFPVPRSWLLAYIYTYICDMI